MIHIPDLRQFSFHEASFDLVLEDCSDLDDESATRYGEQLPIALFCDSHWGQIITLDVAFGSATEDGNSLLATLQLSRYWDWELERDREEATLDQLKYEINTLPRMKWRIYMQASYSVPREMLPARGIVSEMIGLQTRVRRHSLALTGAQFAVREHSEDTVSWFLTDYPSGDLITGKITRRLNEALESNSLIEALRVAEVRLNELILEKADTEHAVHA